MTPSEPAGPAGPPVSSAPAVRAAPAASPAPAVPRVAALTDAEIRERSRAVGLLLDIAGVPDGADPLSGYRELLRELMSRVEARRGADAALSLLVPELVQCLADRERVEAFVAQLRRVTEGSGPGP